MKTIEIPEVGLVSVRPTVRTMYYLFRLAAWPFFVFGVFGLAVTLVPFLKASNTEGAEMLPRVLIGCALAGAFLGVGALIRLTARVLPGRFFLPADWFIIMLQAINNNRQQAAREAATALTKHQTSTAPDLLMVAAAQQFLADDCGLSEYWSKSLSVLDQAIQQGSKSIEAKLDRALALQKLSRFEEAIKACEEVISSTEDPTPRAYFLKATSLEEAGRLDSALTTWENLESAASRWDNADQILQEVKQHKETLLKKREINHA